MESSTFPQEPNGNSHKRSRQRSSPYPSYTIESCIKLTSKIDEEFSNVNFIPSKDISETLNISGGSFLQQLSSCVQYGLLDLKSKEGYKPSALFKKIKKPLPNENVNDALIECLQIPPLYKKLLNALRDEQLPSEKGLANTLDRNYEIKGNAAVVAARVFLRNVNSLGLIESGNILKLEASYIPFEEANNQEGNEDAPTVQAEKSQLLPVEQRRTAEEKPLANKTREIPVFLQGENREAKLVLPIDFTEDDLKRIVKVLNAYLP